MRRRTFSFTLLGNVLFMSELRNFESGNAITARKTDGNPEGKGSNGLLLDWDQSKPRGVVAKPHRQVLADVFTSMLVLSATFKFRPVVNAANYLYWINDEWFLSLISPDEWSNERRAGFAGVCVLQRDMTWTIAPSNLLAEDNPVSAAIGRLYNAFAKILDTDRTLEEILPFYVSRLPYYQRLYASALSRSMRTTVKLGNQASTSCRQWYTQLPQRESILLTYAG